jgi:acyl-CoA dehydrogenase
MDFTPNPDHLAIAEAVDRICAQFDDNYWMERDRLHEFPWDFYQAMAAGGWLGIAIPEQYGGGGAGIAEAALVLNRVAASGAAMNGSSALHLTMFGLNPVVKFGTERLKSSFLPRAAAVTTYRRSGACDGACPATVRSGRWPARR